MGHIIGIGLSCILLAFSPWIEGFFFSFLFILVCLFILLLFLSLDILGVGGGGKGEVILSIPIIFVSFFLQRVLNKYYQS